MKSLITFFLLLFFQVSTAQTIIHIDENFTFKSIKSEMSYYIDSLDIETNQTILNRSFETYDKTFPGVINSKFWFKLKLKNTTQVSKELVVRINTVAFDDLSIYKKNKIGLEHFFSFEEKMNKNIKIPVVVNSNEVLEFYFAVDFTKSIYFPLDVFSSNEYVSFSSKRTLQLGLYYGFCLMVLLINVFCYVNTKNTFFLYYSLLLLSITLILVELDGLFFSVFGDTKWITHVDIVLHLCLIISLMLFTTQAIKLNKYFPKVGYVGLSLVVLNGVLFVVYVITGELVWYSMGETVNAVGLLLYILVSVMLFKKETYARFLVIGYTIIYISNVLYVLPSEFGMIDLGFTDNYFKIGGVIEMIVFLYAISFRFKELQSRTLEIETDLENTQKKLTTFVEGYEKRKVRVEDQKLMEYAAHFQLTQQEEKVLELLLNGATNKQIAEELFVSMSTVKFHNTNIYKKVGVAKRPDLLISYSKF